MIETQVCPDCGSDIPADAPAGMCPQCLLQAGLESGVGPTSSSPRAQSGFVPPTPAELAGRFPQLEILELIGKGGMGAVYKARQTGLDRFVALKILPAEVGADPAFAERFTREARALAKLSHPNIVAVYDFGQSEGLFYFLMELVDGANLRQAIRGGLTTKDALLVVPQICDALQFAHDEGIVHRDIKPENILIDPRGRVKIADFGLAKLLGRDTTEHNLTQTHQVMGTLRYMAPEQLEGSREVDHRADIFSLGVVFYELLTGELPLGRFAPPSQRVQMDVRLDEIVLRSLERTPARRYQHASEIKTEVEAISRSGLRTAEMTKLGADSHGSLKLLLDETNTVRRTWQQSAFIAACVFLFGSCLPLLILYALGQLPTGFPIGAPIAAVAALGLFALAATKQVWELEYRGHRVRFEKGFYSVERIFIDGVLEDRGSRGARRELRAVLPEGDETIVAWTAAGLFHVRCRLFAEAAGTRRVAPPKETQEPEPVLRPWELRWRSTPNWVRRSVELSLALVYLAGIICFFSFSGSSQIAADGGRSNFRIGQPTPWFESVTSPTGFKTNIFILSWPVLIAMIAVTALEFSRRLERAEKGRAHPMWWHYGAWIMLLAVTLGLSQVFSSTPKLSPQGTTPPAAAEVAK